MWTVFSSAAAGAIYQATIGTLPFSWPCSMFISLAITADRTTKNNIFVVLLVASVTNVVYLLSFSQMSSWFTNGYQRPPKILLVHSSERRTGPVCSSRVSTCLRPCPPCRGRYSHLHPNFFSQGINRKSAPTLLNLF